MNSDYMETPQQKRNRQEQEAMHSEAMMLLDAIEVWCRKWRHSANNKRLFRTDAAKMAEILDDNITVIKFI